jgi:hypothetical protein
MIVYQNQDEDALMFYSSIDSVENILRSDFEFEVNAFDPDADFDPTQRSVIGQDGILNGFTSYSIGRHINFSRQKARLGIESFDDLFQVSDVGAENDSNNDKIISLPDQRVSGLFIEWENNQEIPEEESNLASIIFNDQQSINNVYLSKEKGKQQISLDTGFYSGGEVRLVSNVWQKANAESFNIKAVQQSNDIFDENKAELGEMAVVFDGSNAIYVFYVNQDTSNIDLAYSDDLGFHWTRFRDIVWKSASEEVGDVNASLNRNTGDIDLIFSINNESLLYKILSIDSIDVSDFDVELSQVETFTVEDEEDEEDELEGLSNFSDKGKSFRSSPMTFIYVDPEGDLYAKAVEENKSRTDANKTPRFNTPTQASAVQALREFEKRPFYVGRDARGNIISIYLNDDNATAEIKVSYDEVNFSSVTDNFEIHREIRGNNLSEIGEFSLSFDINGDAINLIYITSDRGLFVRQLPANSIYSLDNVDKLENFDITEDEMPNDLLGLPRFVDGTLRDIVKDRINSDEEVLFRFDYDSTDRFDSDRSVDDTIKPAGYVKSTGDLRVFYQDPQAIVYATTLSANPVPDRDLKRK